MFRKILGSILVIIGLGFIGLGINVLINGHFPDGSFAIVIGILILCSGLLLIFTKESMPKIIDDLIFRL